MEGEKTVAVLWMVLDSGICKVIPGVSFPFMTAGGGG